MTLYIQGWAGYMYRDGGTGLAMVTFGVFCQSAVTATLSPNGAVASAHADVHEQMHRDRNFNIISFSNQDS